MASESNPAGEEGGPEADAQVTPARAIITGEFVDDGEQTPPPRRAPSVEERIEFICELMAQLLWERGKTAKRLAAEWGLAVPTVEGNAAEASRRMTADKAEVARDVGVIARRALLEAAELRDFRGVKAMGDLLLDVSGARAPTKVESTNVNANAEATPAEAARLVREAFGEHASRKPKPSDADPPWAAAVPERAPEK